MAARGVLGATTPLPASRCGLHAQACQWPQARESRVLMSGTCRPGVEDFGAMGGWEGVDNGVDWAPSHVPYIIEELIDSTEWNREPRFDPVFLLSPRLAAMGSIACGTRRLRRLLKIPSTPPTESRSPPDASSDAQPVDAHLLMRSPPDAAVDMKTGLSLMAAGSNGGASEWYRLTTNWAHDEEQPKNGCAGVLADLPACLESATLVQAVTQRGEVQNSTANPGTKRTAQACGTRPMFPRFCVGSKLGFTVEYRSGYHLHGTRGTAQRSGTLLSRADPCQFAKRARIWSGSVWQWV